ncbi:acyl carrier protein [Crossiella equi]|uniref:Acyl carrier protein n=1 Tax=Crossiella equi TaxID=130796 RepID=A0ABS5AB37_9PSEU|nr:phosphopantetheine-binding protein [Crossiella equi]MBP2473507.1 acyl carrier protein [Crossiella equi]
MSEELYPLLVGVIEKVGGVPAGRVRPHQEFVADLGLDSLSLVAVVYALEEHTGLDIPDERVAGVRTVRDLHELLLEEAA